MSLLAFFAALFHAFAATVQQVFRKQVLGVVGAKQVGAGISASAAVVLLLTHIFTTGGVWYETTPEFWAVMTVFVIANTIAAFLTLKVLESETLIGAIGILAFSAGLMMLGDLVFFGKSITALHVLGIFVMIGAAAYFGARNNGEVLKQLQQQLSDILQGGKARDEVVQAIIASSKSKAMVAIFIYNFITPATNKFCAMETTATFSQWVVQAGIAVLFLVAHMRNVRNGTDTWEIKIQPGEQLWVQNMAPSTQVVIFLCGLGVLTAATNGLLAYSFELGGSIPGALMMKRVLPPMLIFLYMVVKDRKQVTSREGITILAASAGAGLMAT